MKNYILAALLLTASGSYALAQSLEDKEMQNLPAKKSGTTANPTAKPDDAGLDMKQEMRGQTGKTANPEAQPDTGGLADKEKKDLGLKKSQ